MWPLDSANTVSLMPIDSMSSAGSRTTQGSTVNGRAGSGLTAAPRGAAATRSRLLLEQVGEVGHDDVGAVLAQGVRLPEPVDADDEAEPARAARLDAGQRVLEHDGVLLGDVQVRGGGQERVGRRLARQLPLLGDDAVDPVVDQV